MEGDECAVIGIYAGHLFLVLLDSVAGRFGRWARAQARADTPPFWTQMPRLGRTVSSSG
ncbi:hypothetical protein U91I_03932 [alpha proteobacterium U9-1i]|nr:hypothetical protein U91I_03932 [alpha proteobacterium U9-1i]